jgi:hypothetical protein
MNFDMVRIENREIYAVCSWNVTTRPLAKSDFWLEPIIGWFFNPITLGWELMIHRRDGELGAASTHEDLIVYSVVFDSDINSWKELKNYV